MTPPLPPQQPKKPERRNAGSNPSSSGSSEQAPRRAPALPGQDERKRSASSMPMPSPAQRRSAPRQEPEPEEFENVFSDEPEYDQMEGEDAAFESVSLDEQSILDEQYEEHSEAEQIDFNAEEYDVKDEHSGPRLREAQPSPRAPSRKPQDAVRGVSERKRQSKAAKDRKERSGATSAQRKLDAVNEPHPKDNPRPNFVDEKKVELKPYGRKKAGKAHISDVDRRANLRKKATYVQIGVIGLLALTVGFGFKNAIFPPPTLDETEVSEIVAAQTGNLGFPSQRGQGFATDFMSAWAQRDDSPIREAALLNFYGGEEVTDNETMIELSEFRQEVIYGPTIYEVNPISQWSENYIVGVGVSVSDTLTGVPLEIGEGEPNIQFRYFSIDVYHDPESNSMSIVPGSPSLVPPYEISGSSEMPPPTLPGSGVEDATLTESSRTTVEGYISGYVNASSDNTSSIDQYITEGIEPDPVYLTKGMEGTVELDGEVSDAVTHTVYRIDSEDDSYVAAVVNVRWRDSSAGSGDESGVTYQSTYNMRLMQEAEGRWTVTGFWPLYYVPGEEQ